MAAKLTEKQKKFVNEYLIDLNATQAAIRAGYSQKTASRQAIELLNKTHVAAYLQKRQEALRKKTEITQEMVIEELAKIGFSKTTDFAINGIPVVKDAEHKTGSKLKALELIGKTLGMFEQKEAEEVDDGITDRILKGLEKLD